MRLYHGSDIAIDAPEVGRNTGFADLGNGFYLTDDAEAARRRALSRARRMGTATGVVSAYELDEGCIPWATWDERGPALPSGTATGPFGLRFAESAAGVAAWARYILACRAGRTAVEGLGEPAIVRAWIATEELEMVAADFATPEDLAAATETEELVVQYCLLDQSVIDAHLVFVEAHAYERT